jgi:hypothetical protein
VMTGCPGPRPLPSARMSFTVVAAWVVFIEIIRNTEPELVALLLKPGAIRTRRIGRGVPR